MAYSEQLVAVEGRMDVSETSDYLYYNKIGARICDDANG